jgi:DNA-binding transcriptional regulator LsrR (DeoR family)
MHVSKCLHKVEAILGALRGGFLDVLVTNELAVLRLLELERAVA